MTDINISDSSRITPQGESIQAGGAPSDALAQSLAQNKDQLKKVGSWSQFVALVQGADGQGKSNEQVANLRARLLSSFNAAVGNTGNLKMSKTPDEQFENAFVDFLKSYQPPQGSDPNENLNALVSQFQDFLGVGKEGVSLEDYKETFTEAFGTTEGYQEEVQDFADQQVDSKGYFVPKQGEEEWSKEMDGITINAKVADVSAEETKETTGTKKVQINTIMDMIMLLLQTTEVLQRLVIVQGKAAENTSKIMAQKNVMIENLGLLTVDTRYGRLGRKDKDSKDRSLADLRSDLNAKSNNTIQGWQQLRDSSNTDQTNIRQFIQTLNQYISGRYDIASAMINTLNTIKPYQ